MKPNDIISRTMHIWMDAVRRVEAEPGTPVACAICSVGAIVASDVWSEAALGFGTHTICCTHCGHYSTSRYHLGPCGVTSGVAAK